MNRREQLFLLWAVCATTVVIAFAAVIITLALPRFPTRVAIGRIDDFAPDSVTEVNVPVAFYDPRGLAPISRIWVVRDSGERFTVLVARSPHRGEPVYWVPEWNAFADPILAARWNRWGKYIFGPTAI